MDDEADFAEEVYLGRAPVSTLAQAESFVAKILDYQSTPAQKNWPNRLLYAAEVLFPDPWSPPATISMDGARFSEQMVNELVEPCTEMEYMRMYETEQQNSWDTRLTRAALIDSPQHRALRHPQPDWARVLLQHERGGRQLPQHRCRQPDERELFRPLQPELRVGGFDYSCLMERFVQNPNGGSVLSIGSARAAFPNSSNNYQQGFFEALLCTEETHAGRLLALSRLPYLANTVYNYTDRWTLRELHPAG